jgi:phosphoglycolate phosphatase
MVMVGDTAYDVIGAKHHGIETVGVSWGYGNIQEMQNAGAVAIAHTMEELYHLLT